MIAPIVKNTDFSKNMSTDRLRPLSPQRNNFLALHKFRRRFYFSDCKAPLDGQH